MGFYSESDSQSDATYVGTAFRYLLYHLLFVFAMHWVAWALERFKIHTGLRPFYFDKKKLQAKR